MSEYQYYEFCQINKPLSQEARKEMASLSSRARISTHEVVYYLQSLAIERLEEKHA